MATVTKVDLINLVSPEVFHGENISWETEDGHLMVWHGENLVAEFSPGSWRSIIKVYTPENVQVSSLPGSKM